MPMCFLIQVSASSHSDMAKVLARLVDMVVILLYVVMIV